MLKQLYRRNENFITDASEHNVSYTRTIKFQKPGWIALDVWADVKNDHEGRLGKGELVITVNDVEKVVLRSSWTWTRQYIYVDKGEQALRVFTRDYQSGDEAKIRHLVCTHFGLVDFIEVIDRATMPKPLEKMVMIETLNGFNRTQSMAPKGTEFNVELIIRGTENWQSFMSKNTNFYIMKGEQGLYGGTFLTESFETIRKGNIYIVSATFFSDSKAGVGA